MITVFDIETHPLSEEYCLKFLPDKIGNTTDPEKVKVKFMESLALHAKTAYIACIGYKDSRDLWIDSGKELTEEQIIRAFYERTQYLAKTNLFAGHNIAFDLKFIYQRGVKYGLKPPEGLRRGRYWNENIKDTMTLYTCDAYGDTISLDHLAKHLEIGEKTGSGADFPKLWDTDPDKAVEYLKNDLELTYNIATKLL